MPGRRICLCLLAAATLVTTGMEPAWAQLRRNRQDSSREVPLPVPRPSFLGRTPAAVQVPTPPEKPAEAAEVPMPPEKPAITTPVPTPPEKPAETAPVTAPTPPTIPAPPSKPTEIAPGASHEPAATTPPTPPTPLTPSVAAASTCLERLKKRGFDAEAAELPKEAIGHCSISEPVRLTALTLDKVRIALPDKPLLACVTAETFGDFVEGTVRPLVVGTYGAGLTSISTGPGFECRPRNNVKGAKISAHGQGLAIDIAGFAMADGRRYTVGNFRQAVDKVFDRAVRAAICGYFHTALGPGSDPYHANHWHMDLEPRGRKGESKFCQ